MLGALGKEIALFSRKSHLKGIFALSMVITELHTRAQIGFSSFSAMQKDLRMKLIHSKDSMAEVIEK